MRLQTDLLYLIVLVAFGLWVWKVVVGNEIPDLAGVVALIAVIPVSQGARIYIEARARNTGAL